MVGYRIVEGKSRPGMKIMDEMGPGVKAMQVRDKYYAALIYLVSIEIPTSAPQKTPGPKQIAPFPLPPR